MTDKTFAFVPVSPGPVTEVHVGQQMFDVHRDTFALWHEAPTGTQIGFLFDGKSFSAPAPLTESQLWGAYQAKANTALLKSDGVAIRCVKAGISFPSAWQTYVAQLRNILKATSGDPTAPLPNQPAYPPNP